MSQEIKNEALEQIEKDVLMGFESAEEMVDSISDMFLNEDDFDEDWLAETIETKCEEHRENSFNWSKPTDFDRLEAAFVHLIEQKIVCLHKAGYTKQDSISDCEEAVEELAELGIETIGYCFYHTQDLERAIDPKERNLLLGFDSVNQDDDEAELVGDAIVEVLKVLNFEVNWDGTINQRIEIKNLNWQKIPDEEDWGIGRVVALFTKEKEE
jgi:D-mannonate dehydratase